MNDKEILIETIAIYAGTVSKSLLGFNFGAAATGLAKIGINNLLSKSPYKMIVEFLFDEKGNLPEPKLLWDALKEGIESHPLTIAGIKFNKGDIDEIEKLFNSRK